MRTLKFFMIGMTLFLATVLQAQVSVNVNIGAPPAWGPAGYTDVQYYYLPDVEAYYDVHSSMFIYMMGGLWVHRTYLPGRYKNYDLYGGYKVVMRDYHGNKPYSNFREYQHKYARGYHGEIQRTNGERPGHGNDKENSHGHDKNSKGDHEHGGGNGKKK
jgi:hypothetical protein